MNMIKAAIAAIAVVSAGAATAMPKPDDGMVDIARHHHHGGHHRGWRHGGWHHGGWYRPSPPPRYWGWGAPPPPPPPRYWGWGVPPPRPWYPVYRCW